MRPWRVHPKFFYFTPHTPLRFPKTRKRCFYRKCWILTNTQKNFTKKQFDIKPTWKPETASWENFISLLEKYFFSVGKLFFSCWALSEALFYAFLLGFDLLWLLSVNTKNVLRFHFRFDKRNIILSGEQWGGRDVACSVRRFFPHANLANPANTSFISWDLLVT